MAKHGCGCRKNIGNWLRTVEILSYDFNEQGQVVLNYVCNGAALSAVVVPHQLGILASRLGKTAVEILRER